MLFHVHDSDRPMYVIATSWASAIEKWRALVRKENEEREIPTSSPDPNSITLLAQDDDIIL